MVGKVELGLSLSLRFPEEIVNRNTVLPLNLMPSSTVSTSPPSNIHKDSSFIHNFPSLDADRNSEASRVMEMRCLWKGIDVNQLPSMVECDQEEAVVSSPNSTISSVSGKRSERDQGNNGGDDQENDERASSHGISDEEDGEGSRKKLRLSKDQSAVLEDSFKVHHTLNPKQKLGLAKRLGLRPRQVEVWFQNRRARTKLKQTEVDCELLKRCCENLTEENRRLQKEVQELRALKLSPQLYMQMTPPTTLTMCPSCERVATPSSGASAVPPVVDRRRPTLFNPWTTTRPIIPQHRPVNGLYP